MQREETIFSKLFGDVDLTNVNQIEVNGRKFVPEKDSCNYIWSLADNGWADHTCSNCGYVENTDVHVFLDWKYCPNCGCKIGNRN